MALTPLIRRQMQDELLRLQDELHKTIVFITHDLNEALKLGDRIAIMHDGRVAQIGSPEDIVLRPEDEYVGDFTQDVRLESVLTASKVMVPAPRPPCWVIKAPALRCTPSAPATAMPPGLWTAASATSALLTISRANDALKAGINRLDLGLGLRQCKATRPRPEPGHHLRRAHSPSPWPATTPSLSPTANNRLVGEDTPQRPGRSPGRNLHRRPGLRSQRRRQRGPRRRGRSRRAGRIS